jgi:RecA DNA recombination protein
MARLALIHPQLRTASSSMAAQSNASRPEIFFNGIPAEGEFGFLPGALMQLCSEPGISSGRTTLLFSVIAQCIRRDHFCALVDAADCFDPISAESAGIELDRVLWIRCGQRGGSNRGNKRNSALSRLEQAFKAADILVQSGGFQLIAVDLSNVEEQRLRKVPLTTWFRFARVAEKMQITLLFLTSCPAAHSCADLTLHMSVDQVHWSCNGKYASQAELAQANESSAQVLDGTECKIDITQARKPVQPVRPEFRAISMWK